MWLKKFDTLSIFLLFLNFHVALQKTYLENLPLP